MIKHFCYIDAKDYRIIKNPSSPFYGLSHDAIVIQFNKHSFDKNDDELLHEIFDLTPEIADAAIQFNGNLLENISPEIVTIEQCYSALRSRDEVALLILKNERLIGDETLLAECVRTYPECIMYLGDKQTDELCKIAITEAPGCIQYVKNQTDELCDLAIEKEPTCIQYIRYPTMEQYMNALCLNPKCSSLIPDRQLVHIVDSLSTEGKLRLLISYTGSRRDSGSSLQDERLKFIRKDWRATNIHVTKQ